MAESKLVYRDADGVRRTSIVDTDKPGFGVIHTEVDMTSTVDNIKAMRDHIDKKSTHRLLARVPMTVYEKALIEDWDESDWTKWLNDPDNAAFRVYEGRV